MRTATRIGGVLWVATGVLRAQAADEPLQVVGATGPFATLLADCRTGLQHGTTSAPEARAHAMLGHLRLGEVASARDCLAAAVDGLADADAASDVACWATVAHLWYLRATGDAATVQPRLASLQRLLPAAPYPRAPAPRFAEAAMRPHAWFCLAALLDRTGGSAATAAACRRQAGRLWLELEGHSWQPGRGHFRPHPTQGAIRVPEGPDPSVLAPAAAGFLVASEDRLLRHLRTCVATLPAGDGDGRAMAWRLSAATQLGEEAPMRRAWAELLGADRRAVVGDASHAGRWLDAALFATTGLRLATGAGLDEGCVRLRPWLPPGHPQLALRGLLADAARWDLELTLRGGDLHADERGEPALADLPPGPRLRAALRLRHTIDGGARTIVLQGPGVQYVVPMTAGDAFACSLPLPP
ncbi:MAG: hypothetical protein KF830_01060 [Planctomycetes bacterium]|nr:hypothetical protein [Planctomycetota bacterium]